VPRGFASLSKERLRALGRMNGKLAHARRRAHRFTPEEARAAVRNGWIARWPEPWREFALRAGGAGALSLTLGMSRVKIRLLSRGLRAPKLLERRTINALAVALGMAPIYDGPPKQGDHR
jgi:hypothetical protein